MIRLHQKKFNAGDKVIRLWYDDTVPDGVIGEVESIDANGNVRVHFTNGKTLNVYPQELIDIYTKAFAIIKLYATDSGKRRDTDKLLSQLNLFLEPDSKAKEKIDGICGDILKTQKDHLKQMHQSNIIDIFLAKTQEMQEALIVVMSYDERDFLLEGLKGLGSMETDNRDSAINFVREMMRKYPLQSGDERNVKRLLASSLITCYKLLSDELELLEDYMNSNELEFGASVDKTVESVMQKFNENKSSSESSEHGNESSDESANYGGAMQCSGGKGPVFHDAEHRDPERVIDNDIRCVLLSKRKIGYELGFLLGPSQEVPDKEYFVTSHSCVDAISNILETKFGINIEEILQTELVEPEEGGAPGELEAYLQEFKDAQYTDTVMEGIASLHLSKEMEDGEEIEERTGDEVSVVKPESVEDENSARLREMIDFQHRSQP